MNKKLTFLTAIAALTVTLACTIFVGGPEFPQPPIPIVAQELINLEEQIKAAVAAGAATGEVTLVMTEVQLTTYLTFKSIQDPTPLFTDPQVYLRDGQMRIYGKTQQGNFTANIGIMLTVGLDATGNPELQLLSADFGPFPSPEGLNKAITALIKEAYMGSLGPVATGFRIQSISIDDGVMTIVGQIR